MSRASGVGGDATHHAPCESPRDLPGEFLAEARTKGGSCAPAELERSLHSSRGSSEDPAQSRKGFVRPDLQAYIGASSLAVSAIQGARLYLQGQQGPGTASHVPRQEC